jgi:hypothetical protein
LEKKACLQAKVACTVGEDQKLFKICYKAVEAPPLLLLLLPARSEYSATNFAKHDDLSLRSLLGMSYSDTLPEVPINPEPRSVSC